jgi:uncharacterized membrane protein HdeD (DUF308 family)
MTDAPTPPVHSLEFGIRRLESRWLWFAGFGALVCLFGVLALGMVAAATLASVLTIGVMMVITGLVEIIIGFGARDWGRLALWVASGVLYAAAGALAIARPGMAAAVFTLLLGAGLIASGIVRLYLAAHLPEGNVRWAAFFSGVVTALFGLVIVLGWPGDSLVVLGVILGVDLIFAGMSWLMLGFGLRARAQARG